MGLIVPRRFNGSTSHCTYAANATQNLTAQTWLTQFKSPNVGTGTQYIFGHCDSSANNGVRIQQLSGSNTIRFGADSTLSVNQPLKATVFGTVLNNRFYTFAATWDGVSLAASSISIYLAEGFGGFDQSSGTAGDGTGTLRSNTVGQPFVIGNRTGGSRTWNGDIFCLARWNRILTLEELQKAQREGAASVPQGLMFDWHDGRDWSVNNLTCPTILNVEPGATSPFAVTRSGKRAKYWVGPATITYQYGRPISDIATNGWLPSSGGTLYEMLDETSASDADYIYSPDNPTTQQFEVRLTSLGDPVSSSGHAITVRLQAVNSDTTFDIDLVQNTTILDSWSEAVTVAAGVVERSRTLSGAVADSITDYGNLRIRGVARAP